MPIVVTPPPSLVSQPRSSFRDKDFDAAIHLKGYDVLVYQAIECPCKAQSGYLTTCSNCRGRGWVFIDPYKTRAIITSINNDTKFKEWSLERLGTVSVTFRDLNRVAFMDKIQLVNDYSIFQEVLELEVTGGDVFAWTSYEMTEIEDVFLFVSASSPLMRLTSDQYGIKEENSNVLTLTISSSSNGKVSIRYKHKLEYMVLDLPHDLRRSYEYQTGSTLETVGYKKMDLPVNAIARRSFEVLKADYDGTGIQDNDS